MMIGTEDGYATAVSPSADKIWDRAQNSAAVARTKADDTLLESAFSALSIKI